ncbi:26994_t:CDS:1 [Dentiscutata erythropus]|uniref:26994_t:CDS:1 n=1 Tax=Dentiscutata erythropus TaxID=1348616 RepID=A0A9N9IPI8_9GLOM|nr:26994_t:CDS:1 [Dentiscutata erythropus]
MEHSYYDVSSESSHILGILYNYTSPDFQYNAYNIQLDNVDANNELFEYYDFQYSACNNNTINETQTEKYDETQQEIHSNNGQQEIHGNDDQQEIHNDDSQQSSDESDDSECEKQIKPLVLNEESNFGTWKIAESYLDNYAKQEGFSL